MTLIPCVHKALYEFNALQLHTSLTFLIHNVLFHKRRNCTSGTTAVTFTAASPIAFTATCPVIITGCPVVIIVITGTRAATRAVFSVTVYIIWRGFRRRTNTTTIIANVSFLVHVVFQFLKIGLSYVQCSFTKQRFPDAIDTTVIVEVMRFLFLVLHKVTLGVPFFLCLFIFFSCSLFLSFFTQFSSSSFNFSLLLFFFGPLLSFFLFVTFYY